MQPATWKQNSKTVTLIALVVAQFVFGCSEEISKFQYLDAILVKLRYLDEAQNFENVKFYKEVVCGCEFVSSLKRSDFVESISDRAYHDLAYGFDDALVTSYDPNDPFALTFDDKRHRVFFIRRIELVMENLQGAPPG